jgi:hypothetical protein
MIQMFLLSLGAKLVRHVITAAATALVAQGVIHGGDTETVVGAAMILLNGGWMLVSHKIGKK